MLAFDFAELITTACDRHILVHASVGGFHLFDRLHHVHTFDDLTKNRVTIAVGRGVLVIQEIVVLDVMKNWAVALSTTLVRAMAMLPVTFFKPFPASFLIGDFVFSDSSLNRSLPPES